MSLRAKVLGGWAPYVHYKGNLMRNLLLGVNCHIYTSKERNITISTQTITLGATVN